MLFFAGFIPCDLRRQKAGEGVSIIINHYDIVGGIDFGLDSPHTFLQVHVLASGQVPWTSSVQKVLVLMICLSEVLHVGRQFNFTIDIHRIKLVM